MAVLASQFFLTMTDKQTSKYVGYVQLQQPVAPHSSLALPTGMIPRSDSINRRPSTCDRTSALELQLQDMRHLKPLECHMKTESAP